MGQEFGHDQRLPMLCHGSVRSLKLRPRHFEVLDGAGAEGKRMVLVMLLDAQRLLELRRGRTHRLRFAASEASRSSGVRTGHHPGA